MSDLVGSGREGDPVRDVRDEPHGSIPSVGQNVASIGQVYEFPVAPSGYPAAVGNRYLIYEQDGELLIGRNLTDPHAIDIHGSREAWPKAARLVEAN